MLELFLKRYKKCIQNELFLLKERESHKALKKFSLYQVGVGRTLSIVWDHTNLSLLLYYYVIACISSACSESEIYIHTYIYEQQNTQKEGSLFFTVRKKSAAALSVSKREM